MMRTTFLFAAALVINTSLAFAATDTANGAINVARVSEMPPLSAFASGDIPRSLTRVTGFRQREPKDGAEPSRSTTAYLGFDASNLYVVFVCEEDPSTLRAHLSRREDIFADDLVSVSLDTFRDGRHAYLFYTNALGVQLDGLAIEGGDDDYAFDAVWQSRGEITATGFVVQMTIPFKSLRYADGPARPWGIALGRVRPANRELSTWPYMTSSVDAYIPQFALLAGLADLPRGVHARLVPYTTTAAQRYLDDAGDRAALRSATEWRAGLDAKITAGSDWLIDLTANPDFSQIESDEPQVTVNRRYEVFFPEKRPFFTDRSNFFDTPEPIFFSRRIVDPQVGGRVTGVAGAWTVGALFADDRAADPRDALVAVARAQRRVGTDSTLGFTVTSRRVGARDDTMFSADARIKLNANWIVTAQAMRSTSDATGDGTALFAELRHAGRHFTYYSNYRDRTPDFSAPLGYVPRTDMREMKHVAGYKWRPEHGPVVSAGPSVFGLLNWSHDGRLQDGSIDTPFWIDFKGPSSVAFGRREVFERFASVDFRRHDTYVYYSSEARRWLGIDASWSSGTAINYLPAERVSPFVGRSTDATMAVTWKPVSRLRIAETYLFSRLRAPTFGEPVAFDDHVSRLRASYQFTRELSLRAIVDVGLVAPSAQLVSFARSRHTTLDILGTYMLHPGTALYVGFTNRQENLAFDPRESSVARTEGLGLVTGRQVFVKVVNVLPF